MAVGVPKLPLAPSRYEQSDQDTTRRLIEQVLGRLDSVPVGLGGSPVIITGGAVNDTLRYDGAAWVNTNFLQITTSSVLIGGDPGGSEAFRVSGGARFSGSIVLANNAAYYGRTSGGVDKRVLQFASDNNVYFGHIDASTDSVILRTDGTNRWLWQSTGHYIPNLSDTYDIGAAGLLIKDLFQGGTHQIAAGTLAAAQLLRDDSVTWNNAAVVFGAWKLNVVNTASAVGSKVVDLQIGGTSRVVVQPATGTSVALLALTPGNNTPGLSIAANYITAGGSSESALVITANMNTTGNPSLFYVNAVDVGGAGVSTQIMRAARGGGTLFAVGWEGNVGICGGITADVACRIGQGVNPATIEEGLQVDTKHSNTSFLSHWVVNILGSGNAGSAYTTPVVSSLQIGTYVKALNQTITTWYGIDILAGPTAGTKWSIRTAESVWIKGNLVVDGTISGFSGLGAHTHAETDITDGSLLARLAANETISGLWTFDSPITVGLGGSTSSLQPGGRADFQFNAVGNVGTGEDDLMAYTLPAGALATNGQAIRVRAWGTLASNSNAKSIKFHFGSTWMLFVNATTDTTHATWHAEFYVVRRNTDSQEFMGTTYVVTSGSAIALPVITSDNASAQDDAAAITIKFTGEATANDDIVQNGMCVEFLN